MTESPNPLHNPRLKRAMLAGVLLAAGGIVLFIVLWILLGNAGLDQFPRLIISLCLPPAAIALLVGVYFLLIQPRKR
jgi:lipopolysaccharide export LptBFGC system permease protein LptF